MTQKIESPAELHADHQHWKSHISMWQFDIQEWRSEHHAALEELSKITDMLQSLETKLDDHLDSVETIEAGIEFHEKNLAASLQDHSVFDWDEGLLGEHAKEARKFAKLCEAHERIKKHHHTAMAHVAALNRALEAVM